MNDLGTIHNIPGENPLPGLLCGTNNFAIGVGKKRFLIDACMYEHKPFIKNIEKFMVENDCYFEKIFITHSHFDHMGGA